MTAQRALRVPGCEPVSMSGTGASLVPRHAADCAAGPRDGSRLQWSA
jgi:hypothetical protein